MSDIIGQMMMAMAEANNIRPWDQVVKEGAQADTALIELAELKRQQAAQAQARAYYQQNPGALLGNQGQPMPTLATLQAPSGGPPGGPFTQQTYRPGEAPTTQTVPAPMQPMANMGGGGMPGGPPQSTLASLGPQPQPRANPLEDLMRRNPDAAFQVMQQQQQQQDLALKREEQRLDWTSKKMGYFGQVLQGVNSPESYGQAVQEIGRIDPQAVARLPQMYSKEALQPYIKQALSVKDSADLQLRTMHEQTEQGKLQVQLAQAGYQGLGTDVTSILRGLTPEQVQQFGGRTSDKAIAYATEEEKKRKLAQAGEAERLKFELEQRQQSTLPLQDARKEDAGLFVYKGTGQGVPGTIPYGQIKTLQDEKDPDKGVVKLANLDEKKHLTTLKQLEPVLQQYKDLAEYAYGTDEKTGKKGPMADYQRGPFQTIGAMWNQLSQDDPVFQAKRRALQGQLQSVVRGLGARGDLNAQELEAAQQMLANMDASLGLGLSLGPMVGTGGIGVGGSIKPSVSLPDTPETGINIANELIGTVNRRIGSILQHEGYAKTPYIRIRTDQEREAKPGEMPRATAPPKPGPEPVPTPGPSIFPRPQIVIPGEGPAPALPTAPNARPTSQVAPAPVTRPAPPTARSTPAQDEAYRQSVAPQPAPRPTPGRQSQAPAGARLAGAPKYMNLADVAEAVRQTGKSRTEVERRARELGYTVYGSKLKLPEVTMVG